MSDIVLKIEGLYKQYRLGVIGATTLRDDIARAWSRVRGKEDPTVIIDSKPSSSYNELVWALYDINFEVQQGDVLGVIGKNGAGKSTLLKILSKVTAPTRGEVKIKGRIASLLEVGTGFHPELTGRENIFLNGAILGMTKAEVKKKLDEIIDFSGVEKYIDTPVKRYSSGMYVRLAFAVAAHLEPEILVIDEVLAVGDAEFQKKCLGKMKNVSTEGRTVLFVSHNMAAMQTLCNKGILLEKGKLIDAGNIYDITKKYLSVNSASSTFHEWPLAKAPGNSFAKLLKASVVSTGEINEVFKVGSPLKFEFQFYNLSEKGVELGVSFHLMDEMNHLVFVGGTGLAGIQQIFDKGSLTAKCYIPANILNEGTYTISRLLLVKDRGTIVYEHNDVLKFEIVHSGTGQLGWFGAKEGVIRPKLEWELTKSNSI